MTRTLLALVLGLGLASATTAADWPQWRGPARDGISKDTGLLLEWPEAGPPLRWKLDDVGTGYSSPAVVKGVVYVQTTREKEEFALALDQKTGKDVWKTRIGGVGVNKGPQYLGTRSTPTVDGDRVYCLASDGELNCLGTDGKVRWHKNLAKDFGGRVGSDKFGWAYAESVLVDGDKVVCTPGGDEATLLALNKMTGEVVWKAQVPGDNGAEYSSIMAVEVGRSRQYVQFLRLGLVGVDAKTGKFLWKYIKTVDQGANMLTPVVKGNTVFSASTRVGGGLIELFELKEMAGGVTAKEVYFDKVIAPGIGGAVLIDGHLYGTNGQAMFCAEFATGQVKWTERSVGPASVCFADGRLYARGHGGEVALVEPSPAEYREKGRFKQPSRTKDPAWPHPVVANGGFYLRDGDNLWCYDVRDPKAK
jgi:outer membrane protein assembly factor BamB